MGIEVDWPSLEELYVEHGLPPSLPTVAWRTSAPLYRDGEQVGYASSGCWSPLLKQYIALLETEGVALAFDDEAVSAMADAAWRANSSLENIGARRLHTVLERVLEELSFEASEIGAREIRNLPCDHPRGPTRLGKLQHELGRRPGFRHPGSGHPFQREG